MKNTLFDLIRTIEMFSNETMLHFTKKFPYNISISSILLLEELRKRHKEKPSALAEALGYTPGNLTSVADKLGKEGYIQREKDENDRRVQYLVITEKGNDVLEEAQQIGQQMKEDLYSTLSEEELEQLLSIYRKLHSHITKRSENS